MKIRGINSIREIDAARWDGCAGIDRPFGRHAFLSALEESGSAVEETGWAARHLLVENEQGRLLACAPLYLKSHSYGEYVFDWAWAEAWQRAGFSYYPKLLSAVPFTPVTGRRLLVHPQAAGLGLERLLAQKISEMATRLQLSSAHINFATEEEVNALEFDGWLLRLGQQFHWINRGYRDFEDFLGALSSRKRKLIRKERQKASELGLRMHTLTGDAITAEHWQAFYRFYLDTVDRKWSNAYLTLDFFLRLGQSLRGQAVLMMAEQNGQWVAGALNLRSGDTLYGRNWGALGDFRWLHFELCYYRAIDFAIAEKMVKVEAGAQGEHKLSRGYEATPTWSAHWIPDPQFRAAVAQFLKQERSAMTQAINHAALHSPYRQTD
ncbi:MAG TPA: N-acetyltransferase [Rhodospirillaceae bacterium]|nr:N-acetyltransferase [Rhodospirillaceae bacterium]